MFITYTLNIDYLIEPIRIRIGDIQATRFSDSIIRAAIISGIKYLQRRWGSRYLVYTDSMLYNPGSGIEPSSGYVFAKLGSGYVQIPSGLSPNDVFRNPTQAFTNPLDTGLPISQEDEYAVVIAASVVLRSSVLSSSADSFQVWSDGEFSYSNVASSNALTKLLDADLKALEDHFKGKLITPIVSAY